MVSFTSGDTRKRNAMTVYKVQVGVGEAVHG